ncbi:zinc ribbon domain-containing protein [Methylacidiphilum sp. Yel]|uniref:zinc ribbon domain-containing protein n=1 Tax=Methylacidiphilum sp. Yel TaxID=1847730 RepID=UPI001068F18B|nr:zinc ribbon domain-containing protein [Methylacidiphilum sp. Yel]
MNRRNIAVESNTLGKCRFYPGGHRRHLAKRAASRRSAQQAKGTCGATRDGWHGGAKGYPLSNRAQTVREGFRQTPQGQPQKEHLGFCGAASQDGLQNPAAWRSVPDWVDADSSSQRRPVCWHVGRENRPNKGLLFVCAHCWYTLHADLVAARNISMRTLFIWQDWVRTGRLSAVPKASGDEAKAARLSRYAQA